MTIFEWRQNGSSTNQEANIGRRGGMWEKDYEFDSMFVECEVSVYGKTRSVPQTVDPFTGLAFYGVSGIEMKSY